MIAKSVRLLLSVNPGAPWFVVTRQIQQMNTQLLGRQGRRQINKVIGLMIESGEINRDDSRLFLTTVHDRRPIQEEEA